MKRTIFFISDSTGITAETLGNSLLTQFTNIEFDLITLPYVDSIVKAQDAIEKIQAVFERDQQKPIIFSTMLNIEIKQILSQSAGLMLDFFQTFLAPLEKELGIPSNHSVGKMHGMINDKNYMLRMNAVNFTLNNDDGANIHDYARADVILIGVSRCGKTPTSIYLAMQFGIYAANYPFTDDEFETSKLPDCLLEQKHKLFGLSINPERLQSIREERRPNSRYASQKQCSFEIKEIQDIYKRYKIPQIETTQRSVEELATEIILQMKLKKRL